MRFCPCGHIRLTGIIVYLGRITGLRNILLPSCRSPRSIRPGFIRLIRYRPQSSGLRLFFNNTIYSNEYLMFCEDIKRNIIGILLQNIYTFAWLYICCVHNLYLFDAYTTMFTGN